MGFQQSINSALITAGVAAKATESTEAGKLSASLKATETLDKVAEDKAKEQVQVTSEASDKAQTEAEEATKAAGEYKGDKRKKEYSGKGGLKETMNKKISAANDAKQAAETAQKALQNVIQMTQGHALMQSRIQAQIANSKAGALGKINAIRTGAKETVAARSQDSLAYEKLGVKEGKGGAK